MFLHIAFFHISTPASKLANGLIWTAFQRMFFISPWGYWFNIMRSLTEEGYIVGLVFPASIGSAVSVKVIDLRITQKGIEFLQENSMMKKAAAFLKTIKETVPCI